MGISRQAVYILARNVMDKLEGIEKNLCFAVNIRHLEEKIKRLESENESLREELREKEEGKKCLTH